MGNMSYCRFHNTLEALRECEEFLEDETISESEKKERRKLIELCESIAESFRDHDEDL